MKSPQNNPNPMAESATAINTASATANLLFDVREAAARLSISVVRKLIRLKRLKRVPDFCKVLKAIGAKLAVPQFSDTTSKPADFNDPAALAGTHEIKRKIESAAVPRQTDVEMFNASTFTISPYSTGILTFSTEIQLSPHSALMGGQFPATMNNISHTDTRL